MARQRLRGLCHRLAEFPLFEDALTALAAGRAATIEGVVGSSCALAVAAALTRTDSPLVLVLFGLRRRR